MVAQNALLEKIISGDLAPGLRLNLDELCTRLEISRTPIREALLGLAREHFVEVTPNAGTQIAHWGIADMSFRAQALGAIARFAVLDGSLPPAEEAQVVEPDLHAFVTVCAAFTATLGNSLARRTADRHIAPLELFLHPGSLHARGIEVRPVALASAFSGVADAVARRSAHGTASALDELTVVVMHTLSPTGIHTP